MSYQIKDHLHPLHHVGFIVKDLDKELDFYINVLGFDFYNRWEEPVEEVEDGFAVPGASLELAQVTGHGCMLEFIRFRTSPGDDTPFAVNKVGTGHVSFLVDDMDEAVAYLKSVGIRFVSDPVRLPNSSWVLFYDPEGIRVEIMQFYDNNGFEDR